MNKQEEVTSTKYLEITIKDKSGKDVKLWMDYEQWKVQYEWFYGKNKK